MAMAWHLVFRHFEIVCQFPFVEEPSINTKRAIGDEIYLGFTDPLAGAHQDSLVIFGFVWSSRDVSHM